MKIQRIDITVERFLELLDIPDDGVSVVTGVKAEVVPNNVEDFVRIDVFLAVTQSEVDDDSKGAG